MMWDVFARLRLVALGLCVLAAGSVVEASVLSFKAVKKNDVTITNGVCNGTSHLCTSGPVGNPCTVNSDCPIGTNNLSVLAGDKIEVHIFLSAWANDFPKICLGGTTPGVACTTDANCPGGGTCNRNVRTFQVKLNRAGFVSPDAIGNGSIKPLGWCGPVDKIQCTTSAECLAANPAYPTCLTSPPAGCTCSPHTPADGGFISNLRPDFVLFGLDGPLPECVTSNIDYKYFGLAESSSMPDVTGVSRYVGTLILKVSANACGSFSIGSVQEITSTFIADPATKPNVVLPSLQPLVLTIGDCTRQLSSCSPGHCNIDARIAHDRLDQSIKLNTNSMVMTFSKLTQFCSNATSTTCNLDSDCPAGGTCVKMTAADFEVTLLPYQSNASCTSAGVPYACCTGAGTGNCDVIPTISAVTATPANRLITTVTLSRRIQQTRWTCIREKGSNKRCCMGSLPADADNSRISQLDDTFEIFDNLQGGLVIPALTIEKCDTDRSVQCSPADLLMVVDLLNGADAFDPVSGNTLPALAPACPTMTLPP